MDEKKKFEKVFYSCPGAWTGYHPDKMAGCITVDATKIIPALKHIQRHYTITQTRIPENPPVSLRGAVYVDLVPKVKK